LIAPLNHADTADCVKTERALCRYLGGGCHVPIAAYAKMSNEQIVYLDWLPVKMANACFESMSKGCGIKRNNCIAPAAKDLLQRGAREVWDYECFSHTTKPQGEILCDLINQSGDRAIYLPTIDIVPYAKYGLF